MIHVICLVPQKIIKDVISNEVGIKSMYAFSVFTKAFICEVMSSNGTPGDVHVEGSVCRIYRQKYVVDKSLYDHLKIQNVFLFP